MLPKITSKEFADVDVVFSPQAHHVTLIKISCSTNLEIWAYLELILSFTIKKTYSYLQKLMST